MRVAFLPIILAIFLGVQLQPLPDEAAAMFDVSPPGTVVKQQTVYLHGEAMSSEYLAVASRLLLMSAHGTYTAAVYQPYLTIYEQDSDGRSRFQRIYQSPGPTDNVHLIPRSIRPAATAPYLPQSLLRLVGAAEFMQSGMQQLVVTVHSAAADCGNAKVVVIGMDRTGQLSAITTYQNACDLSAQIKRSSPDGRAALILSGPYYAPSAPLCCPTKAHVSTTIRYSAGRWLQNPPYFNSRSAAIQANLEVRGPRVAPGNDYWGSFVNCAGSKRQPQMLF